MPQQETGDPLSDLTDELVKVLRMMPEDELKKVLESAEREVKLATKLIIEAEATAMKQVEIGEGGAANRIRDAIVNQFTLEELTEADKGLKYLQGQLPMFRMLVVVAKNQIVRHG